MLPTAGGGTRSAATVDDAPEPPVRSARSVEIAEAAALAVLVAAVSVVDRVVPLAFAGFLLGALPAAVIGARHRARACVGVVVTATLLAFVGAGPGMAGKAFAAAAVGAVVGVGLRRDWSTPRIAAVATLVPTLPVALLATALLALLADLRNLALSQVLDGARGLARLLAGVPGLPEAMVAVADVVVRYWWVLLPAGAVAGGYAAAALTASLFRGLLERVLPRLPPVPRDLGELDADPHAPVAPVPLRLRGVGVRRGGRRVLAAVDLDVVAGRMVTVTGPNGAGKSTLGRVVGGLHPEEGRVERPGRAGLGRPGGTAMVFQHPESQVLGVRVGDDVRWGAPPDADVEALLDRVGLAGTAERETATLSGGELQRLALAAALARRPTVIVSDETTAMLDPAGRREVAALLAALADAGTAVVHTTHRRAEIDGAAHHLALVAPPGPAASPPVPAGPPPVARTGAAIVLRDVAVVHDEGTPWRRTVLDGVDLAVPAGHTLLVTGPNGAGKTTLAGVLAGLTAPSRGRATLDGAPLGNGRDGALLGVQHARLSLLRSTVGEDVRDASGADPTTADAALTLVGLDPVRFRHRGTDELSGGEARRVALAGLLAARARVLVLDEPLAGLDDDAVDAVVAALSAVRATGTTLVVVTHDETPLAALSDDIVRVEDGTLSAPEALRPADRAPDPPPRRRSRDRRPGRPRATARPPGRPRPRRVGRTLPFSSPVARLRPGTKLGVLVTLVVALGVAPQWTTVAAGLLVLAVGAAAARMPPGAWPRLPLPLVAAVGVTLVVVALGAPPTTTVAGVPVSLAAVERSARLLAVGLVTLAGSVLFVATTPVGTLPALLRRVVSVLAWTRLPVHEWALTAALGLRMAPALVDEVRTVRWVLGQRRRSVGSSTAPEDGRRRSLRQRCGDADVAVVATVTLVCATALRRAAETADALVARGGLAGLPPVDGGRAGGRDAVAVVGSLCVLVGAVVFAHTGFVG